MDHEEDIVEYICRLVRKDQEEPDVMAQILNKFETIDKTLDGSIVQDIKPKENVWEVDSSHLSCSWYFNFI